MRSIKTISALALAATVVSLLCATDAGAIPAFARRYKMSCTTCHTPFPRLKPFGDEFAANGFIIPEEEKDRDYVVAGDELLRLNKDFPVAIRFDAFAFLNENQQKKLTADMQTPFGVKLLSGGGLASNVGYYFYFFLSEKGEVAGIEDAYLHFNDLGGAPLDILVGQFQACDPLMKRELRLTYEDYLIYKTKVGRSNNNLAYDRGVIVTYDLARTGTGLVGMILNGNGKDPATSAGFDADKYKNFFLRVSQDVGKHASVGYFGYYGDELGFDPDPDGDPLTAEPGALLHNRLLYHGPDLKAGNGTFDFSFQYLLRRDTNPDFTLNAEKVETDGYVGELVISPRQDRSRHYVTLLYNRIKSYYRWEETGIDPDYETYTVAVTRLARRNLRLTAEVTYDNLAEKTRGAVGLVSAF